MKKTGLKRIVNFFSGNFNPLDTHDFQISIDISWKKNSIN